LIKFNLAWSILILFLFKTIFLFWDKCILTYQSNQYTVQVLGEVKSHACYVL
jgi:hypothetical protein